MTTLRMTKQRAAVLEALEASSEFRSAQAWHEVLRRGGSTVGLATVYRSLQALAEAGDVDSVVTDTGETLYRQCGVADDHHHHHLRCRECGRAEDIDIPDFEAWADRLAAEHGYTRVDHTAEITGVCATCSATNGGA